jgi:hypothetical protein
MGVSNTSRQTPSKALFWLAILHFKVTVIDVTLESLRLMLTRRPFEPMRVKTNSGKIFEIRHPEMASLARSAMVIVHANIDGSPSDKVEYISYLHIASVETLAGEAA